MRAVGRTLADPPPILTGPNASTAVNREPDRPLSNGRYGLDKAECSALSHPKLKAMTFLAVITTVGSREQACSMAAQLVERGLAACAQISEIESFYRWDGALQQESEWRLLLKTRDTHAPALQEAILSLHSYALPAIHSIRLEQLHPAYADWLATCLVCGPEERGSSPAIPMP
jgi:periplasmic divalent cation tolerance protein